MTSDHTGRAFDREDPVIQVARTVPTTAAEGPGLRYAIWVQGCTVRCPGCFNPHLWTTRGGTPIRVSDIAAQVTRHASTSGIEGITLLGGEPFEQAPALASLAQIVRSAGLSVMTFTGYTVEHLAQHLRPGVADLLDATDLLVDGRYDGTRPDLARPWVGSTNQRFHDLTGRYRALVASLGRIPDRLEVRVAPDGRVRVNGWASVDDLDLLLGGLGARAQS